MYGHTHQSKHKKNVGGSNELQYRQSGEEYATVNSNKGDARFEITIYSTNQVVIAKARGAISKGPKKQRIEKGDLVLVALDNSTSAGDKYYIIHKYSQDDVKRLRRAGELSQIKEAKEDDKIVVAFDNEVIAKKIEDIEIDDDFISNI